MTKDQIADAFQRHFHQFGFKKTAVDDVAGELGISKKTIYQHFSSKEEILQYVIERNAQDFLGKMAGQMPPGADEGEQLTRLIRLIHQGARDFQAANLSFTLQFRLEIATAAYRQAYSRLIASLVTAGAEKGVFQVGDLPITIHFIQTLVTESVQWLLARPDAPVEDETIRVVRKILA